MRFQNWRHEKLVRAFGLSVLLLLLLSSLGVGTLGAAPGHYFASTAAGSISSIENPIALKQYVGGGLGLQVIYDDAGNLYYTDFIQVWRLNADGTDTLVAGKLDRLVGPDNGIATQALFTFITGLGFDSAGNLYISDTGQNSLRDELAGTVRQVTPNGHISTVISEILPSTIAVDGAGDIYLADSDPQGNGRITEYPAGGGAPQVIIDGILPILGGMFLYGNSLLIGGENLVQVDLPSGSEKPLFNQVAFLSFAPGPNRVYLTFQNNMIVALLPDGTLVPVAGTGQEGSSGDGGPATQATFGPTSLAVNPVNGDLAMFDATGDVVRVISAATGKIQTVAGASHSTGDNGPAVLARIQMTTGLASDPSGNVYFWDLVGASIRKVSPSGIVTKFAGTGIPGNSGDGGKATAAAILSDGNLVADKQGNLYFVNVGTGSSASAVTIRKIDTNGMISTVAGGGTAPITTGATATNVALNVTSNNVLAVDSTGAVYFGYQDSLGGRILKIDASQRITLIAGGGSLPTAPDGTPALAAALTAITTLAVDSLGKLYFGQGILRTISSQGLLATVSINAQFDYPQYLVIDGSGNLIFAFNDSAGGGVLVLDPTGDLTQIAGQPATVNTSGSAGDGGDALQASFNVISGMTLDPSGDIYVADGGVLVRKLTPYNPSNPPPFLGTGAVIGAGGSVPAVQAVSAGGVVSVFGANFFAAGMSHVVQNSDLVNGTVPTNLVGVCVNFGTLPAAILAVYPTQINLQVGALPAGAATVQVTVNCGTSNALASNIGGVVVQAASPEFYSFLPSPTGNNPVTAITLPSGTYVGPPGLIAGATFAPVAAGAIVQAYGTGWGTTTPAFGLGVLPGSVGNLASAYSLTLGGVTVPPANILYAGISPCCAGFYQIDFTVPSDTPSGNQSLVITVAGEASPPGAYIAVQ
jgi:uncharacterized protein (TIGR03437 family)